MPDQSKRKRPSSNTGGIDDKYRERHVETLKQIGQAIKKHTKESLRKLKIEMNQMTLGARDKGGDRPSLRQQRFEEIVGEKLKKQQKGFLEKLNDMFASYDNKEDYARFLERVKKETERTKKDMTRYQQAVLYSVRCLAGYNGKIEVGDYAYFYTLLENISDLYGKNVKIGEVFAHIKKDTLKKADWDVLCKNIKTTKMKLSNSATELKLSTSAFFIKMMKPHQRMQLLREFNDRYKSPEAKKLADQMVQTNVISLKQHDVFMTEITGSSYVRSKKEEKLIRERRRQASMLTQEVRKNLKNPMAINAAERIINRKSIGSAIITGIGVLGMFTNYMAGISSGKGIGRFFKGLKSPYFLLSAGVTAGGVHAFTGSLHPGKGVGALDKLISKPRRLDNPFGASEKAEKQDAHMKRLAAICADHSVMEDWLLQNKGFDDLWGFYSKKRFDSTKLKSKMLTKKQREKIKKAPKKGLYEELLDYVEHTRGNKRGATRLREAKRLYGKAAVENMIFESTVSAYSLGINTTAAFHRKTTKRNVKYHDLFLYRQGVKPRPMAMRAQPKRKPKQT